MDRVQTTFYQDFTIADAFGVSAVKDTYKRAFKEWKGDIRYIAELSIALNTKDWDWAKEGNDEMQQTYDDLFYKLQDFVWGDNTPYTEEELDFYHSVTD